MSHEYRIALLIACLPIFAFNASAQVKTGTPPFGSFAGGPDVIDLGNLNSHLAIPVVRKSGRGLDFTYDLSYDSSVWYPTATGSGSWQPVLNWGWRGQTEIATGYVSRLSTIIRTCRDQSGNIIGQQIQYSKWVYHDPWGTPHPMGDISIAVSGTCGEVTNFSDISDGYTLTTTNGAAFTLKDQAGKKITAPVGVTNGSGSAIDRNGNQISVSSGGVFTDTLGTTALTVAGTGTPASPMTFTYTAPSTGPAGYTMKFQALTVKTNFGCSGIADFGPTTINLVTEIDLPDYNASTNPNSKYTFAYEPTPGFSGDYTGRLTQVTLPTGGTINYAYSGGSSGHITCTDGSAATLTRTTPDGAWTYARAAGTGAAYTTTVTDPQSNVTTIQFQGIYETQRIVNQGASTVLKTINTCYNGSASPCTPTAIMLPITRRTVLDQYGSSGSLCKHDYFNNSYGLVTEIDDYDYPAGTALLRKQLITYDTTLGNGIVSMPKTVTVCSSGGTASACNGSGTVVAQSTITYDQGTVTTTGAPQHVSVSGSRGNATTVASLVQGTTTLNRTFTYFDTGNVNQATDVNGANTTYTYSSSAATCGFAFPTGITEPLSLSRQMTWNCTGGVQLTDVDENSKTTTTAYSDPYSWRPASVTDRSGAITNLCYPAITGCSSLTTTQAESTLTFNSGASTSDVLTTVDSLGRPMLNQRRQAPGSANFDTTRQIYNTVGLPSRVMLPYVGTAGQANGTGANVTTTYDALGRPTAVQDSASGITNYAYIQGGVSNNDVLVTIGPAPTGENTKRRQLEYDALGRLRSVCEMSSGTGSGACAQVVVQTGYWTKYTYDALGNLTGVTQNAQAAAGSQQTRSYSYDGLSRIISETNPESGTTTNIWDSATVGVCSATSMGDLIVRTNAAGVSSCNTYDALHRILSVGHNPAQASSTPDRFFVYDAATVNGVSMTNTKTRLAEAYTCLSPCTKITDEGFSYTARGETSDLWQSTPHSAGYYHTAATYWANGAVNVLNASGGTTYYMSWIPDGEGRVNSTTDGSGGHPLTGTTYNAASLPTQLNFSSGDSDTFTYDPNTNRMSQYKFTVGTSPQSVIGNLTWNANGTLKQLAIIDPFNSANAQTCIYTHDDLLRIATANCGTAANQTFTYDAFGNLNKTGSPFGFSATYSTSTNRMTTISGSTPTYDANGNVTNDFLHTYAWDADGEATTVDGVGLTYDALGRMVEQNRSGSFTQFAYSPTGFKMQMLIGQSVQRDWVPLPAGAEVVYATPVYVRHPDWLGSFRFASNLSTRTMYSDTAYAPFGEPYAQAGTTDLSFTGKDQDTSGSLYDFPARKYGIQGRWPSPDPAGIAAANLTFPQSWNRYAYVQNSPLGLVDPLGLCSSSASKSGKVQNYCPGKGEDGGGGDFGGSPDGFLDQMDYRVACTSPLDSACINYVPRSGPFALKFTGTLYGKSYDKTFDSWNQYADWRTGIAALPESQIYQAFLLIASNQGLSPNAAYATGYKNYAMVYSVWIPDLSDESVNQQAASDGGGWRDPLTYLHGGASSWYFGAFWDVGHLVDSTVNQAINAHVDPFGPFNPLHYIIQLPSMLFPAGAQGVAKCAVNGGCATR